MPAVSTKQLQRAAKRCGRRSAESASCSPNCSKMSEDSLLPPQETAAGTPTAACDARGSALRQIALWFLRLGTQPNWGSSSASFRRATGYRRLERFRCWKCRLDPTVGISGTGTCRRFCRYGSRRAWASGPLMEEAVTGSIPARTTATGVSPGWSYSIRSCKPHPGHRDLSPHLARSRRST